MSALDAQRRLYEQHLASATWSAQEVLAYQRRMLPNLIRHARENVPFYAKRLDVLLRRDGKIDWDRWLDVPIVRRRDMVEHRDEMQARRLPDGSGTVGISKTSGSSGTPISISVNSFTVLVNNALRWRLHTWHGVDWSKSFCSRQGDDPKVGTYPDGKFGGVWGPPFLEASRGGKAWLLNRQASMEENLRFLIAHDCTYYNTGPNIAHAVAVSAELLGLEIRLEAILAQGQRPTDADRAICSRVMGARIIEHYSSKEAGQMAHPCPEGRLHVNSEHLLLEIVDKDGQPCPLGVAGRVVVTPLFSTAQPLIRYDHGDIAAFAPECTCGRHGPILAPIEGRMNAMFRHPDGRIVSKVMPEPYRETLDCEFWQTAQVGPNTYEVRYVPRKWSEYGDEAGFIEKFKGFYFADSEVVLRRMREIPLTPGGKHLEYVNEYSAKSSAHAS